MYIYIQSLLNSFKTSKVKLSNTYYIVESMIPLDFKACRKEVS